MGLRTKIILAFLVAGILPLVILGIASFRVAEDALLHVQAGGNAAVIERSKDQLVVIRDARRSQIKAYLDDVAKLLKMTEHPSFMADLDMIDAAFQEAGGVEAGFETLKNPTYMESHDLIHSGFATYLKVYGFYDLFLLNIKGDLVYSVTKEADYATNFLNGPYESSGLGKVFREASTGKISFQDFESYAPSAGAPAAFFGYPLRDASNTVMGVMAIQLSIDEISRVMGDTEGMGKSGETYLVGKDFRLRSNSRLNERLTVANSFKENITIETAGVRDALAGTSGAGEIEDYRGEPVLSAYTPFDYEGVRWALLAEIDVAEAYEQAQMLAAKQGNDIDSATRSLFIWVLLIGVLSAVGGIGIFMWIVSLMVKSNRRVEVMAMDVSDTSDQFSESAHTQSQVVGEITMSVEELIASIQDVAHHSSNVSSAAHTSEEQAKAGGRSVGQAIEAMELIKDSSEKINDIIEVISDIAEQTNLLALNAAIEAARAGDQGRGFAVVADEVRKLAERSATAAQEITNLIKQSGSRVQEGVTLSNKAGEMLKAIVQHVEQTAEMVEQISAATEEQAATSNSIKDGMSQISGTVEENAAASEELASSAQRMLNEIAKLITGKMPDPKSSSKATVVKTEPSVEQPPTTSAITTKPLLSSGPASANKAEEDYLDW